MKTAIIVIICITLGLGLLIGNSAKQAMSKATNALVSTTITY